MKYKQMQMILEPTSIEKLFEEKVDDETLEETMLLNWESTGSPVANDDYWRCIFELPEKFLFDERLTEFDTYKGIAYKEVILKLKNRYFACQFWESAYDCDMIDDWEEVKPIPETEYKVTYVPIDSPQTKTSSYYGHYKELFEIIPNIVSLTQKQMLEEIKNKISSNWDYFDPMKITQGKELLEMLLEKPQNKAVEQILTDVYDAGRGAVLKAYTDWEDAKTPIDFLVWYQRHRDNYIMHFKVKNE